MRYVIEHDFDMANKLITRGSNKDYTNRQGRTCLHMAITLNDEQSIKYLLSKKVAMNIRDISGMTAIDLAKNYGYYSKYKEF